MRFTAASIWLFAIAGLIFAMILVGGATRLTDSGLSITEWRPLLGAIPPLSAKEWADAFALYQQIPEYAIQNRGMSLDDFKVIYWWEWGHRQLGRIIGLAFAVPMVLLFLARRLSRADLPELGLILLLGGAQGAIGWWMVSSGLADARLDVSHYRLATHLGMALVLLVLVVLAAWKRALPVTGLAPAPRALAWWIGLALGLAVLQAILGGLVAGLDAGRLNTDWPLFQGKLAPASYWDLSPWWLNLGENIASVQFNHRAGGYILVLTLTALAIGAQRARGASRAVKKWLWACAGIGWLQAILGVAYLVWHAPFAIALAHQGGGALLIAGLATALAFTRASPAPSRLSDGFRPIAANA